MNKEFKKIKSNSETRYVLETATAGATSSGAIATSVGSVGKVQKRNPDNILAQESDKVQVPTSKPRNFVAKNAKTGGAGQHRDKKKEQKQGKEKHKKPYMEDIKSRLAELKAKLAEMQGVEEGAEFGSNYAEQLAQQIFNKRQDISSEDEVLNQAYHIVSNDQGQKRARYMFNYDEDFPSDLVSAYFWLQKNSDGVTEYGDTVRGQKMLAKVHHRAADRVTSKQADKDPAYARKAQQTQDRAWDRLATKEEVGFDEVSPKSASYILRKLDQGVPMSSILDDFPELSRMMDVIAHERGLHPDDDFEQIEDVLMNDLEDIAAQEDDFGDYDHDEEQSDEYMESLSQYLQSALNEKAVSKAQQRFMGMVHAAQKGEKPASKEVAKVAKGMGKKAAKDFASTKHKGLPEKKPKK